MHMHGCAGTKIDMNKRGDRDPPAERADASAQADTCPRRAVCRTCIAAA